MHKVEMIRVVENDIGELSIDIEEVYVNTSKIKFIRKASKEIYPSEMWNLEAEKHVPYILYLGAGWEAVVTWGSIRDLT